MKIVKWVMAALGAILLILVVGLAVAWYRTAPEPLPQGSESAARLAPGPWEVSRAEFQWVDESRRTAENGDYPGSEMRSFPVVLWFPKGLEGRHPLLVFVHGLMSSRYGCTYMAEHLASYGYIVLSADYPLTNWQAPGGPNYRDVVNQPADVSFLIDRALALNAHESPFAGEIDPERIGVFGISLGGATATLAAFHPEWRDRRVAAALSIAGPGDIFGPRFFDHASVLFLMIAGTADAVVDYEINAAPIPDRVRNGGLLTIEAGTHVGFTHLAAGLLRLLGNPDTVGCAAALRGHVPQEQSVFVGLFGTQAQGLITPARYRPPCGKKFEQAMRAGRQHMITMLAVQAFFESRFAVTEAEREAHGIFLRHTLPAELAEATYTPSRHHAPGG